MGIPAFGAYLFPNPSDMHGHHAPFHITLANWIRVRVTSLGLWEWGCPKRGDVHITVTMAELGVLNVDWMRG